MTVVLSASARRSARRAKIRHGQEFGLAVGQPLLGRGALALRTVPVAAGVVGDLDMLALVAAQDVPAQRCGAAVLDRRHHLELAEADMAGVGLAPRRAMAAEDIRNLQP